MDTFHGWSSWLVAQGLEGCLGPPSPGALDQERELDQARELRGELRALASGELCSQARRVDIQVALSVDGQVELSAQTAVGLIAAAAATVAIQGRIGRVKICPADDCRWAFYDESRNQSRQWCSMKVCGNRAKARNHRARSAPA
jgi:predicted RNA-binding Zn ribbon-like protein